MKTEENLYHPIGIGLNVATTLAGIRPVLTDKAKSFGFYGSRVPHMSNDEFLAVVRRFRNNEVQLAEPTWETTPHCGGR